MEMVESLDHVLLNHAIEYCEVVHHASRQVNLSRDSDFQDVIVPVAVRIVALPIDPRIFLRREGRTVQAMRRGEAVSTSEVNHQSP